MRVEAEYMAHENRARIDAQNNILSTEYGIIARQRFLNIFIGIIAALLVIITFILIRTNHHKKLMNDLLEQRVKERTKELEINKDLLQRSLNERDIQMQRLSGDIKRTMATIKGLCFLGMKDKEQPTSSQYMDKIDSTSDQLLHIINRFC